jgi:hypothetical protein
MVVEPKGKKAKCLFCGNQYDNLADHLQDSYLQTRSDMLAYLIQDLMIQIEQMQNQIRSLQNQVFATHGS